MTNQRRTVRSRLERLAREIAKFGAVGAIGFVVNLVVFNACRHLLHLAVVRSGIIATAVAIAANYVGNRYWTYRDADRTRRSRELSLFLLFSGVGLVIENGILAISHYGLHLTDPVSDNIAKNVVGLGLGTVFRFWSYRTWVFRAQAVQTAESFLAELPRQRDSRSEAASQASSSPGSRSRSL
ncbi:GtrA family protein [Streptomyces sp. NPDC052396]|uniref:GtrA family protein n=1 Tax=Streptomyces sp. NPDC052396 TaxID=3365689 RepID=UPI0037D753C2